MFGSQFGAVYLDMAISTAVEEDNSFICCILSLRASVAIQLSLDNRLCC